MFKNPQIINRLWSEEVEQGFLGCLLANPNLYESVSWFKPDWLYVPVHARIFEAIREHKISGRGVSAQLLAQYFAHDSELDMAGGETYLREMAEAYAWSQAAKDYASHLRALHIRRMLVEKCDDIKAMAANADPYTSPESVLEHAEKLLADARDVKTADSAISAADSAKKAIELARNPKKGINSGMPSLDKITGGFQGACLYVLAGRPGMGKTAMGLTLAVNAAIAGNRVLFFSLEMSHAQLMQRVLSRFSGSAVHSGDVPYNTDAAVEKACGLMLDIDDASGLTALDICARATQHKRRNGLDMVVVDYLGLVQPSDKRANKVHQLEEVTQAMKRLSKDLGIPVILLSQLSRALEGRDEKRPGLGDLRDSGAIEQDADCVMFVYRDAYYEAKPKKQSKIVSKNAEAAQQADIVASKDAAEIIIAKNRQGRLGTVELKFNGEHQVFHEP